MSTPPDRSDRRRATLATIPFLALGLADVLLLLWWGLDPLWSFLILPPILFMSALTWVGFKHGFVSKQTN